MKLSLIILSILLAVTYAADSAKEADALKVGAEKLKRMEQMESQSSGGVINFSVADFKYLVEKNPRPYDVVLLWNVPPGRMCDHCITVQGEFEHMVYSFVASRGDKQAYPQGKKLFFGNVLFSQTSKDTQ